MLAYYVCKSTDAREHIMSAWTSARLSPDTAYIASSYSSLALGVFAASSFARAAYREPERHAQRARERHACATPTDLLQETMPPRQREEEEEEAEEEEEEEEATLNPKPKTPNRTP
jgi:hypothetical protein